MGLIGCIVGECSSSYHTLLTARIIQGFSSSAFESIVVASIGYVEIFSNLTAVTCTSFMNEDYVYLSSISWLEPSQICNRFFISSNEKDGNYCWSNRHKLGMEMAFPHPCHLHRRSIRVDVLPLSRIHIQS